MNALVVGGGRGAERKVGTLLRYGVPCSIVAPRLTEQLEQWANLSLVSYLAGSFYDELLEEGFDMVIAATNDSLLNEAICQKAKKKARLYTSLSDPECGNFQFAASLEIEGLSLAIHTDFRLPEVSQMLKDRLEAKIPKGFGEKLEEMSRLRSLLKATAPRAPERLRYEEEYRIIKRDIEQLLDI